MNGCRMTRTYRARDLKLARYRRARWWLDQGVSVVPIKPRSKKLYRGFGPRKARITDPSSARKWFASTDANLGVVLGGDTGLIVADWDTVRDYRAWRNGIGSRVNTLTERTARGYHLFFFGVDLPSATGNGCELITYGVCTVYPSVHSTGAVYRTLNYAPIARIGEDEALQLFPFLSKVPRKKGRSDLKTAFAAGEFETMETGEPVEGGIVARIKEARSTVDEMHLVGVELRSGGKNTLVGLCPFHDDHHPSLWVYPHSGLWGCNKPSCSAAGIHDVINFRALVRGISNRAAIEQLANEFL